MEDNRLNRMNVLDSLIDNAIKEVSLQYVQKLTSDQITRLKNEFEKNKTFSVSQTMLGNNNNNSSVDDYESQLVHFPYFRSILNETASYIKGEQEQFVGLAKQFGIASDNISIPRDTDGEFSASVIEVLLEGLRYIQPPILEKKDKGRYEAI
jgi:magnesium chelatase subunit I